ncbi:armadillo-type protein [Mycena latifolia]|nr:armadillo-type protein [Mycena latifolia]
MVQVTIHSGMCSRFYWYQMRSPTPALTRPSMPSLTRQRTLESIRSWWSDSNPPGPTIDLHAAAKPLMRLMYHRQAMEFVKKNRSAPLSPEVLGIYADYVACKYVSLWTKTVILEELGQRVAYQPDASVGLASAILDHMLQLLQSPDFEIRSQICIILRNLARHESCARVIGESLVAQLRDSNFGAMASCLFALTRITDSPNGAAAAVEAGAPHLVANLLESPIPAVRNHACEILVDVWDDFISELAFGALIRIAHWPGGAEAAVAAKVLDSCAEWLGSPVDWVRRITNTADGAQAAVAAKVLRHVTHRLMSSVPQIRISTCELLVKLARHQSIAAAVLDIKPCERLVALLIDNDVAAEAFHALCNIANSQDGAEAVVASKVRDHLAEGVVSHAPDIQGAAWTFLHRPQAYESTAAAVLAIIPCERLGTLLSDSDGWVVIDTFGRLSDIAKSPEGAEATVTATVLDQVVEHLASPASVVRAPATELLVSSTIQEVVDAYPNENECLVSLVRHHRWGEVGQRAMIALSQSLEPS